MGFAKTYDNPYGDQQPAIGENLGHKAKIMQVTYSFKINLCFY